MPNNVDIIKGKSRLMFWKKLAGFLFVGLFAFLILTIVCFGILDVACKFGVIDHYTHLHIDWQKIMLKPLYLFELYGGWWNDLLYGFAKGKVRAVLFVPFLVPVGIVSAMMFALFTSGYSFSLWYVLNHHFAKLKDVEMMGINKGVFMVLGKFAGQMLSVRPSESVLCIGEMGCGKTSSVAIPSILRSDNACVIAVDMTGLLPKYTAGYRAKLGKVFYYNWDLPDDPENGVYYPRWNPLDEKNMPTDNGETAKYLKRIADYLVDVSDAEKRNYWNILANSMICSFLGYWHAKVRQAKANDYFLRKLIEGKHLTADEKDILLSYYISMPAAYTDEVLKALEENSLNKDNYLPIGSWAGIPEQWIGKNVCFAAITDWLIENYIASSDDNIKDWRGWLFSLLQEIKFFDYGDFVRNGLEQVLALSARQRQIVFACAIKPFKIFTNQALRERTNGNDFNLDDVRGIYDEEKKAWVPVTVYSLANNHASKILNQMFIDETLNRNLNRDDGKGIFPLMFVLDDVGHNLRLKNLADLLQSGKNKKMSALLLCNSLNLVEKTYSKEELEFIVMNTSCKIIKAPNNKKLARQLDKLAVFATKSVQIPKIRKRYRLGRKKYFADAALFHRLALDFSSVKNVEIDTKKHQVVLVEGYYHRPILADQILFFEDDVFRKKAVFDVSYMLPDSCLTERNLADAETPKIGEIFNSKLGVNDLLELDNYMQILFEKADFEIDEKKKHRNEEQAEVSAKAENQQKPSSEDWWMEEDAFDIKKEENPFYMKK